VQHHRESSHAATAAYASRIPALTIPPTLAATPPPATTRDALDALAAGLDDGLVPAKHQGNLLIGTWNVAIFGDLTEKWVSEQHDSPKRNLSDACAIAEVISRFDVCAVQETRRNLTALQTVMRILGPDWAYVVTDVTEGGPGNGERLCFIHDRRRARSSGLVGEIVLPTSADGVVVGALDRQFARTPYAVSFAAGEKAFTLVTLHALYGASKADKERRRDELQAIAQWLADRADDPDAFNRNLITLGDFNIDRRDDPLWLAFASTGLGAPKELDDVPRNITYADGGPKRHYDQIAWFTKGNREALTLSYVTGGYVKWTDYLLTDAPTDAVRKAHISDHYPLWVEFSRA
jgi:hypothetical protein